MPQDFNVNYIYIAYKTFQPWTWKDRQPISLSNMSKISVNYKQFEYSCQVRTFENQDKMSRLQQNLSVKNFSISCVENAWK